MYLAVFISKTSYKCVGQLYDMLGRKKLIKNLTSYRKNFIFINTENFIPSFFGSRKWLRYNTSPGIPLGSVFSSDDDDGSLSVQGVGSCSLTSYRNRV